MEKSLLQRFFIGYKNFCRQSCRRIIFIFIGAKMQKGLVEGRSSQPKMSVRKEKPMKNSRLLRRSLWRILKQM